MPFGQLVRRFLPPSRSVVRREAGEGVIVRRELPSGGSVGNGGRRLPPGNGGKRPNGNGNGNGLPYVEGQYRELPYEELPPGEEEMAKGKGKSSGRKKNGKRFARAAGKAAGEAFTRGAEAGASGAGRAYRGAREAYQGAKGKYQAHQQEKSRTKAEEEAWWEARFQEAESGLPKGIPPSKRAPLRRSVQERIDHEFEVRQRAAELGIPEYVQPMTYDRTARRWIPDYGKKGTPKSVAQLEREIQQHEQAIKAGRIAEESLERLQQEEFPSFKRRVGKGALKGAGKATRGAYKKLQQEQSPIGQQLRQSRTRTPLQFVDRPPGSRRPGGGFPRISETLRPGSSTPAGSRSRIAEELRTPGRPRGFGMPRVSETLRPSRRPRGSGGSRRGFPLF